MIPTPKSEPVLYSTIAAYIVGAAARYGLNLDENTVLGVLTVLSMVAAFIARRRTVAIHPSTGVTVKTAIQVVTPPKSPLL